MKIDTLGFIIIIGIFIITALVINTDAIKEPTLLKLDSQISIQSVTETTEELEKGAPGTLLYEGLNRQRLRMWEELHRMEWWLMHQKNIRIERIYFIPLTGNYTVGRYYVQYMEE